MQRILQHLARRRRLQKPWFRTIRITIRRVRFSAAIKISATDNWSIVKKPFENSLLNIENSGRGVSIAVFRYSKDEFDSDTTLETFSKAMQVMFLVVSKKYNPVLKESAGTKVGNYPAFEYEASISSGKAKVRYLFINLETPTHFYKLGYSSTTRSGFSKPEIRELLDSFKELEVNPSDETPSIEPNDPSKPSAEKRSVSVKQTPVSQNY